MWSRTRKIWCGCWLALVLFGITVLCGGNDAMAAGNTTIENKALATSLFECYKSGAFKDKITIGDNSGTDLNSYKPVDVLMKDKSVVNVDSNKGNLQSRTSSLPVARFSWIEP